MKDFQKQARNLTKKAKSLKIDITYSQSLELIASLNGFESYAALKKEADHKIELENKAKNDPNRYFCINYFAHRKDSGSFYRKINKAEFDLFCKNNHFFEENESIIQFLLTKNQLSRSDVDYVTDIEELSFDDYPEEFEN